MVVDTYTLSEGGDRTVGSQVLSGMHYGAYPALRGRRT